MIFLIDFFSVHKSVKQKRKESNASSIISLSFVIDEELPRPDPPSLDNHLTYKSSVRLRLFHFFQDPFMVREYKYRLKETNKDNIFLTTAYWNEKCVNVSLFALLIYTCWCKIWSLRLKGNNFHKLILVTKMS